MISSSFSASMCFTVCISVCPFSKERGLYDIMKLKYNSKEVG